MMAEKNMNEAKEQKQDYNSVFWSAYGKAVTACDIAGSDILDAREKDGKVDTKTLKEVAATLKDLNGLGTGQASEPVTVYFSHEAEKYGV